MEGRKRRRPESGEGGEGRRSERRCFQKRYVKVQVLNGTPIDKKIEKNSLSSWYCPFGHVSQPAIVGFQNEPFGHEPEWARFRRKGGGKRSSCSLDK